MQSISALHPGNKIIDMERKRNNSSFSFGTGSNPYSQLITKALADSTNSVIVSALCFFAATFGVGLYSNIDMISSICILLARGAIISMFVVVFILPSMFMIFDKVICATSAGFKNKNLTA